MNPITPIIVILVLISIISYIFYLDEKSERKKETEDLKEKILDLVSRKVKEDIESNKILNSVLEESKFAIEYLKKLGYEMSRKKVEKFEVKKTFKQ